MGADPNGSPGDVPERGPAAGGVRRDGSPDGASGGEKSQGGDLQSRIEAARRALEPEEKSDLAGKYNSLTLAWRMVLELVVGSVMGFGMGWGLDSLLGTKPWLMIVFGLFGMAAGVKLVLETAQAVQRGEAPPGPTGPRRRGAAGNDDESA